MGRVLGVRFNNDDEVRVYFRETECENWTREFWVCDKVYVLELIVANYSQVYTGLNIESEWFVMNSGTAVKVGSV